MYESLDILHLHLMIFWFPLFAELHCTKTDDKVHEAKRIKPISKTLI